MTVYSVDKLMARARLLARDYKNATGKPLAGISGEVALYDAVRLLGLELCQPPPGGYDAIGHGHWEGKRVQIKGRAILDESKSGHRIGQLKLEQEWDSVMLVLMDENFDTFEIYEAEREEIVDALQRGASNRNRRGAMSVTKFKAIGKLVWTREGGVEHDEIWDNQAGS